MMGEEREARRSGGVSVVQDRSQNSIYQEYFRNGSIFATSVQGTHEMKIVVPAGTSLTITTVSRELSSGTCRLKYKGGSKDTDWLLLCKLHGEHPVTGLGLTCVGPDEFYLEAKGTKINVFGSVSSVSILAYEQTAEKVDGDVAVETREGADSSVVVVQDRAKNGVYQKSFATGSVFATTVQGTNEMKVTVPRGVSLNISTVSRELSSGTCKLNYKGAGRDAEWHLLSNLHGEHPVTSLGITSVGPTEFFLKAPGTKINVFGSVLTSNLPLRDVSFVDDAGKGTVSKESSFSKKRKHEVRKDEDVALDEEEDGDGSPPQLSKKQRRKLAKRKAKELAEAVATLNMHSSKSDAANDEKKSATKSASLTKERRLPNGVIVKDLMLGTGNAIKTGRKVSIIYEGSFPDGKVFDRNKNRNKPLSFRLGTGQVVRGLENGLEGMKVGGEREITIPPQLGYGKKGSGNVVPPHATLVFSVQVVGTG